MGKNDILVVCLTTDARHRRLVANTGWTNEARQASIAVRQAKAAARGSDGSSDSGRSNTGRDRMFDDQKKAGGKDFLGNWYPRGDDGKTQDPRIGESTPDAPYGYVEGTTTPRKEPLYDQWGRPIIPQSKQDWFEADVVGFGALSHDYGMDRAKVWIKKVDAAENTWGPFGQKKKFMDAHPGATNKDWDNYDREQGAKKKGSLGWKSRRADDDE